MDHALLVTTQPRDLWSVSFSRSVTTRTSSLDHCHLDDGRSPHGKNGPGFYFIFTFSCLFFNSARRYCDRACLLVRSSVTLVAGRSDGVGLYTQGTYINSLLFIYPAYTLPKSVQVNFYGIKMTLERLLNMSIKVLYFPNLFIPPQNKFMATPLAHCLKCDLHEIGHRCSAPVRTVPNFAINFSKKSSGSKPPY